MSSRSNGVTNVRLIRSTSSWVSRSPWCSSSLMSRIRSSACSGKSSRRSVSCCEISTAFAAAWLKRSKNSRFWGTRLIRAMNPVCIHGFAVRPRRYRAVQMGLDIPDFQAYQGTEPPRFASQAELECAKVLDYYGIPWLYEPRTFVLEQDEDGRVREAFAPGLLPSGAGSLHRAHRDEAVARHAQEPEAAQAARAYPDIRIKLFYKRDLERLAQHFRLDLAS